jgi:hypothetical protein
MTKISSILESESVHGPLGSRTSVCGPVLRTKRTGGGGIEEDAAGGLFMSGSIRVDLRIVYPDSFIRRPSDGPINYDE